MALQGPQEELPNCISHVAALRDKFQRWREGVGVGSYAKVFEDSEKILGEVRVDQLPGSRRGPRTGDTTPYDHYRRAIYLPFIDYMSAELESRFSQQSALAIKLCCLIPKYMMTHHVQFEEIKDSLAMYLEILPSDLNDLEQQYELWHEKFIDVPPSELPSTISKSLDECSKTFTPGIYALLQIFATVPVSTATAERSFSALKLLKTYLRSTMVQDRISSLALIYIHKDLKIDIENIIDKFALQSRRLKFN